MRSGSRHPARRAPLALAFALVACGKTGDTEDKVGVATGVDARAPEVTVEAILQRTQGDRRGTFGRAIVELREDAQGPATTVSFDLPERMRIVDPRGRWTLRSPDGVTTGTGEEPAREADQQQRRAVEILRRALDALCLLPLERVARVERIDGDTLALWTRDGERFELDYEPALDAARVLRGPDGTLTIVADSDRAGRSRIPMVFEFTGLGRRHVRFVDTGVDFQVPVFSAPGAPDLAAAQIVVGGPAPSLRPRIRQSEPARWLMTPDPGDWSGRLALFAAAGSRLGSLGYGNGGDPMLVEDEAGTWFVVPFVPLEAEPRAVTQHDGERVVDAPARRTLTIDVAPGEWNQRIASARATLESFALEHACTADGKPRLALNLLGRDPVTNPACLIDLPVKVIVDLARN